MRRLLLLVLGLLLAASAAEARMHAGPTQLSAGHRLKGTAVQDGMATSLAAAYSFRKVRSAYAGPAVKLLRTTGGVQDVGFTAAGDFDVTAAATFCAATTCFLDTWYDQSGLGRHMTQATPASQPQYIANCNGTLPCAQTTSTAQNMAVTVTVPAGPLSSSVVGRHLVKPGGCVYLSATINQNVIYQHADQDLGIVQATAAINNPAASLAWHSHVAVINGAASVNRVDAAEVTGTLTTVTGTGPLYFSPLAAGATCQNAEMLYWSGYALTPAERAALQANQKIFWSTP